MCARVTPGIEEFTTQEEEDAPCLHSGTGKMDPYDDRSYIRSHISCDPPLVRSKYYLRAPDPEPWSKLRTNFILKRGNDVVDLNYVNMLCRTRTKI